MRTTTSKLFTMALTAFVAFSLNSCKKEIQEPIKSKNTGNGNNEVSVAQSASNTMIIMDNAYFEVMKLVQATQNGGNLVYKTEGCAIESVDSSNVTYHIATFDFGTGCLGNDGKLRSGLITLEYTPGKASTPGNYFHATASNFTVDSMIYNGQINLDNQGANVNGNLEFSLVLSGLTADNTSSGNQQTLDASLVVEWQQNGTPGVKEDDLAAFTGNLASTDGATSYAIDILTPAVRSRDANCSDYFIQGEVRIQKTGDPDRYLDYGGGTCDADAFETINGNRTPIVLTGQFE